MANFAYTTAKAELAKGTIDLNGGDDIRSLLVMTNTTADTEEDAATLDAITTLDEMDGANYVRKAFTGEAVTADTANDRAEFDVTGDTTWEDLGAGTRQVAAVVIFKHVTDDTDSIPLFYIDTGGFPFSANGGDFTVQWNAEGIAQIT